MNHKSSQSKYFVLTFSLFFGSVSTAYSGNISVKNLYEETLSSPLRPSISGPFSKSVSSNVTRVSSAESEKPERLAQLDNEFREKLIALHNISLEERSLPDLSLHRGYPEFPSVVQDKIKEILEVLYEEFNLLLGSKYTFKIWDKINSTNFHTTINTMPGKSVKVDFYTRHAIKRLNTLKRMIDIVRILPPEAILIIKHYVKADVFIGGAKALSLEDYENASTLDYPINLLLEEIADAIQKIRGFDQPDKKAYRDYVLRPYTLSPEEQERMRTTFFGGRQYKRMDRSTISLSNKTDIGSGRVPSNLPMLFSA